METIVRRIKRLADLYALTADMLENETGDLVWSAVSPTGSVARIWREKGGLMITVQRGNEFKACVYYGFPGEAGDYLQRAGYGVRERWTALVPV